MERELSVSIIIPVYNQEKYIEFCLRSILSQCSSDMECIVVNDGSTDRSDEIIKKFTENAKVIYLHQPNSGVSVARNAGLEIARGKWIAFIDPDDTICEGYFQRLLAATEADTDIIISSYNAMDGDNLTPEFFFDRDLDFTNLEEKIALYRPLFDVQSASTKDFHTSVGVPWGRLYRREFIEKWHLRFDPALRRMQDNEFNGRAFFYAGKISYRNINLYNYRVDHISTYIASKYHANASEIFMTLFNDRYSFLQYTDLLSHEEIHYCISFSVLLQAYYVFKSEIFNKDNPKSINEKKKDFYSLCSLPYVKEAMDCLSIKARRLDVKDRLKVHLIRGTHYWMTGFIIAMR